MRPSTTAASALARSAQVAGSSRPRVPRSGLPSHLPAVPSVARSQVSPATFTSTIIRARSFFSLPDISKLANLVPGQDVESSGEEQRFHARKILPYTPAQLYELVSDVPAYAGYIPFCTSSTVLDADGHPSLTWKPGREPFTVDAELAVGFGGLEERYVSRVVGTPFEQVSAVASKRTPLFKNLVTTWSFKPATQPPPDAPKGSVGPTLLTIDLTFVFANPLHRIASQAVLPKVADKMVEAFETRANEVWGPRR